MTEPVREPRPASRDPYLDTQHFDPEVGEYVLRNLVGATTYAALRDAEDILVEAAAAEASDLGIPHTLDYDGLKEMHGHLFGNVYEWAGRQRTIDIAKGMGPFTHVDDIGRDMRALSDFLRRTDGLTTEPAESLTSNLARVYDEINQAHPFREGNGRTNREFLNALAARNGVNLHWPTVIEKSPFRELAEGEKPLPGEPVVSLNDVASEVARHGNRDVLVGMFDAMSHPRRPPALPSAARAAFPAAPAPPATEPKGDRSTLNAAASRRQHESSRGDDLGR